MEQLIMRLKTICGALQSASIPYMVDGDTAIFLHMKDARHGFPHVRRKAAVVVELPFVARLVEVLSGLGFQVQHSGTDMEVAQSNGEYPARITFFQCVPGSLEDSVRVDGLSVASVARLVLNELTRFRLEDRLYVRDLDQARLITPEIEASLSDALRARLAEVRATE
jgi:hypothetical protein